MTEVAAMAVSNRMPARQEDVFPHGVLVTKVEALVDFDKSRADRDGESRPAFST